MSSWIVADEASRLLRVSRATLYAYVSRGYVRSQAGAASSRERLYSRDDLERLRRRTEERRDPDKAAARTLQWGLPVLESSIALIDGQRLFYRGHDAVELARSRSLAEVASLIWSGGFDTVFAPAPRSGAPRSGAAGRPAAGLAFVARAQAALAAAADGDPTALDLRAGNVAQTGWKILHLLTAVAAGSRAPAGGIEETLARAWRVDARDTGLLGSALILCADHELNVSSFTARCVASAGSHPYAVVIAGLAALEGTKHGGLSLRVESLLDGVRRERTARRAIAERLRRGEPLDGFGHPLYPGGDPRASALLELLGDGHPRSAELEFVLDVAGAVAGATGEKPSVDFALAALARVLGLPSGAPLVLFAIGRTIGWIGHAIEQYATEQLIRPRARYVGVSPIATAAAEDLP